MELPEPRDLIAFCLAYPYDDGSLSRVDIYPVEQYDLLIEGGAVLVSHRVNTARGRQPMLVEHLGRVAVAYDYGDGFPKHIELFTYRPPKPDEPPF